MMLFTLLLPQVPTSQKKEGVYDVPKNQPVSVSISPLYPQRSSCNQENGVLLAQCQLQRAWRGCFVLGKGEAEEVWVKAGEVQSVIESCFRASSLKA